jgi:undecaprenyl-diphosphatase
VPRPDALSNPPPAAPRPGLVETPLLLTLFAVALLVTGFLKLTGEMREGETGSVDRTILLALRVPGHLDTPIGPRWLQESARDISALGGFTVLILLCLVGLTLLIIHRRRLQALVFVLTVVFAEVASAVLKTLLARPRPDLVPHLDLVYSASFPSGHAMMSPVVYLTLAAVLAAGERRRSEKVVLIGGAAALAGMIGVSRVYLGVHWPTDVLAGWALGCAIAAVGSWILSRLPPVRGLPLQPPRSPA